MEPKAPLLERAFGMHRDRTPTIDYRYLPSSLVNITTPIIPQNKTPKKPKIHHPKPLVVLTNPPLCDIIERLI